MITKPPDPGQLVDVRQRRFVVTEVAKSSLPPEVLRPDGNGQQHLVTLSSVEDDAMGEELRVIWELEPGARALEKGALPEPAGFDEPRRLDAFLDAVRWGAISSANVRALQSPFRSGIDIEDYQLDPVVRALGMPRVNLLVADDVGLGKTIETGLVAQELILRHRARTILVVCPASIQIQWRDQMRDKFGLDFRIVDSSLMKDLRRRRGLHVNPWTHFPRLITSIDFLKRERVMRLFRETLPAEGEPTFPRQFDLLIVDEAHNVAPSGTGRYATDSARTQAIRTIAPHFEHKLFLTATPHNGYPESFSSLLELLDNQRFARGVPPDKRRLGEVMVRRLKSELPPKWDGTPRFPERKLEPLEVEYTEGERRAHEALREYTEARRRGSSDHAEKFATEFVLKLLKKRLFSSPKAFATTLEQHERSLETARRRSRHTATQALPKADVLRRQVEGIDEDFADDEAYEEATEEAVEAASRLFREPTPEEAVLLRELGEFGRNSSARADSKAKKLMRWLHETLKPDGDWGNTRVLIFTEYRATQNWLAELFAAEGLSGGGRLEVLHGGMNVEDRERIKAAFQAEPAVSPVRILLATDAASEGIDLQNHCSRLIHYEIPWNPNRMEQRNGRVDRHGQRASEVLVYHFVGKGYERRRAGGAFARAGDLEGDLEFLMRAAMKIETIREDLGKVGPVIASRVEEAMLGRQASLDTSAAERGAEPVRRLLRFERKLAEQMDRLREQLLETRRDLGLSPENIRSVVEVGLEIAGRPPLIAVNLPDASSGNGSGRAFRVPALSGSWARAAEGLAHPHTGEIRPIVFDQNLAKGRDDIVLAHLEHRLVRMCLGLLRAEVWSEQSSRRLNRVTARLVPDTALGDPVVVAHGRLVVLGGDNHRLHEEVITAGGVLREGRFARMNVGETRAALDAALPDEVPESVKTRLQNLWPSHKEQLYRALEVRMNDRTGGMRRQLDERASQEASATRTILEELERTIRAELEGPEEAQLELFSTPEREQFERNKGALRNRLRSIPGEIERETQAIYARYADPVPRLFPVAVTYLIPEKIASGGGAR